MSPNCSLTAQRASVNPGTQAGYDLGNGCWVRYTRTSFLRESVGAQSWKRTHCEHPPEAETKARGGSFPLMLLAWPPRKDKQFVEKHKHRAETESISTAAFKPHTQHQTLHTSTHLFRAREGQEGQKAQCGKTQKNSPLWRQRQENQELVGSVDCGESSRPLWARKGVSKTIILF